MVEIHSDSSDSFTMEGPEFDNTAYNTSMFSTRPTVGSTQPRLTAVPMDAPLRIRVRVENECFMIPCPRRVDSGDTTVDWLANQAGERYYLQRGVRPRLTLTTLDGALLCSNDPLTHVLQDSEEVVGVVEHWHLPPLRERYQTACRNAGVGMCVGACVRGQNFNGCDICLASTLSVLT